MVLLYRSVFDGAKEKDVTEMLELAKLPDLDKHIYGMAEQVKNLTDQLLWE